MTKIWKETGFVNDDPWVIETDETKAGSNEKAILNIDGFMAAVAESDASELGVLINPADDVMRLQPYLERIALVRWHFRLSATAGPSAMLRCCVRARLPGRNPRRRRRADRPDPAYVRCGVDSFAVTNATAIKRLSEGRLPGISNHYQPTAKPSANINSYSWRRVS